MKTLEELRQLRPEIQRIADRFGVRQVRIFGSVARGEVTETSDVDVLVDFERGRSLLDLVGFEHALEDLLGCEVDVLSDGGISPYLEKRILSEAVLL